MQKLLSKCFKWVNRNTWIGIALMIAYLLIGGILAFFFPNCVGNGNLDYDYSWYR